MSRTVASGGPKNKAAGSMVTCSVCLVEKPSAEFTPTTPYSDGTPRVSSACRPCKAKMTKARKERQTSSRIVKVEAPRSAIRLLVDRHPEIAEQIARRYPYEYLQLLEQEKARLLYKRAAYLARIRERHAEKRSKRASHTDS